MCKGCALFKSKKCDGLFGGCEFYQAAEEQKKRVKLLSMDQIIPLLTLLACLGILLVSILK